jgi:hypothetical protein
MPSIEELLNEAESHMAAQPVNDVLEINPETREISIPDSEIILGVETDQKAERKYFHCPKIVGNNIDLSALELYVVFQNASNKEEGKDRYHVTDVKTTSDGYITFSWELSAKVTAYKGDVQFVVCAIKTDSSGVKQNVWNTTIAIGKCLIGLSSDMSASEEQSASDLYTQLISELNSTASAKMAEVTNQIQTVGNNQVSNVNSAGTTQVNNVQNKGTEVLASIPDTYTELDASVKKLNEQIRGKAPVIVESITSQSGKPVSVSDSAEMPLQGLRVYGKSEQVTTTGKNLCSIKSCQLSTNVMSSDVIPWTKSSQVYYAFDTQNISGAKAYISVKYHDADKKKVGSNGNNLVCDGTRKNGLFNGVYARPDGSDIDLTTIEYISVQLGLYGDSATPSFVDNIIVSGDENASYEPYTGGKPSPSPEYPQEIVSAGEKGSIGVEITGKNLLGLFDFHKCYVSETNKFVSNSSSVSYSCETKKLPEKIILSGNNINRNDISYTNKKPETGTLFDIVNVKENPITIKKEYEYINIHIAYGSVPDNVQIEKGTEATSYEPYKQPQSLPITTPTGLSAIPVPSGTSGITYTDAGGQAWIADEIDFARGKYVQRVWKGVFDGSSDEEWSEHWREGTYTTRIKWSDLVLPRKILCNQYIYGNGIGQFDSLLDNGQLYLYFNYDNGTIGMDAFKALIVSNPIKVMTYLNTPIETDLSEAQIQAYKSLTTFKPTSIISNDAGAQMEVEYACDTKTWVTNKINTLIKEATTS